MSYKYQKSSNGEEEIVIGGFEDGIGESPFNGIQLLSGVNIKNFPGVVFSNLSQVISDAGSTRAAMVNYIIQDKYYLTNLYALDSAGVVYQSLNSGFTWAAITSPSYTSGRGNGNGIVILQSNYGTTPYDYNKSWLIVCGDVDIYAIELDKTTGSGVTGNWTKLDVSGIGTPIFASAQSQLKGLNHFAIASINVNQLSSTTSNGQPVIFFCNNKYISSLQGVDGETFDPTDPTTYEWNEKTFNLPVVSGGIATSMVELRGNLYTSIGNLIVPWNYESTLPDIPFAFTEFVNKMVVIDNIIYCFGGTYLTTNNAGWSFLSQVAYSPNILGRGNIYYYDGWSGGLLKKIPDHLQAGATNTFEPAWIIGGVMNHLNNLYFSATTTLTSPFGYGVMSIDVIRDSKPLVVENSIGDFCSAMFSLSNSNVAGTSISYIASKKQLVPDFYYNYFTYTTQTLTGSGSRVNGRIISDIIRIGTKLKPKTFTQCEIRLRNPLAENEIVLVRAYNYYNHATTDASTNYYIYTAPATDTNLSFTFPVFFQQNEYIQIIISTSSLSTGVPIREIILR